MRYFALADPHLSLATADKGQEKFGPHWRDHDRQIAESWRALVADDDVVLVAGDISWALRLPDALPDLQFLAALPGTKVLIKGNHDYWWHSISRVRAALPPRMIALEHDAVRIGDAVICGTRLWDVPGVRFDDLIAWGPGGPPADRESSDDDLRIYRREVGRLERALADAQVKSADAATNLQIVMTHYPPCDAELHENELTRMFEQVGVQHVVFGHLHSLKSGLQPFGAARGVQYHLTACDYLDFRPRRIA